MMITRRPGSPRILLSIFSWLAVAAFPLFAGCAAGPTMAWQRQDALPALAALRAGEFDRAARAADEVVKSDPDNAHARLVSAITRYKKAMHQLSTDVRTVLFGGMRAGGFNHRYMRSTLVQTEKELARVEDELAAADREGVAIELCLACWAVDWNHDGRVDRRDRWLFEIERDASGARIPAGDPRRRPTFRFDRGDVAWARAFVAFQRGALDLALAYEWTEVDKIFQALRGRGAIIRVRMARPELVGEAKKRILEGLAFSDRSRREYLKEEDDDREWLPSPRQKDHPMPLPVDAALYRTWAGVVDDLRRLVAGKDGLSVAEVAQLGDHRWDSPPGGFVDIGKMLSSPKDIVLDLRMLTRLAKRDDVEGSLTSVLGEYYVRRMKPSPIVGRLSRMKKEVSRGKDTFNRKLRYLLWIN